MNKNSQGNPGMKVRFLIVQVMILFRQGNRFKNRDQDKIIDWGKEEDNSQEVNKDKVLNKEDREGDLLKGEAHIKDKAGNILEIMNKRLKKNIFDNVKIINKDSDLTLTN